MRALSRPPWEPRFASLNPSIVAQATFGRFCMICERHLAQGGIAWLASTGAPVRHQLTEADWSDLLLLCRTCAAAGSAATRGPDGPLLPDRDAPFSLTGPSDLTYELREVSVVSAGDSAAESVERVVVVPRSSAGAATIRRFALNTPYHAFALNTSYHGEAVERLVLPAGTELANVEDEDPRLESRTTAWWQADRAATAVSQTPASARAPIVRTIAWGILFGGHWSVWATVLNQRLGDRQLLEELQRHPFLPRTRVV